ncbi:MAG: protein-L-isoaspartate(D-aspartate) O-methyltransferase [Bacteroidales bacterium]|nr:protein-L-isoaspartate(D-aspartate) O-methyltransferase [Bacteroidales bacterium]
MQNFINIQMTDSYKHKGLRKRLVETLKNKGIKNQEVLDAIMNVPRHLFMAKGFEERAYQDNAFPIAADQTISQPYTVAFQTSLLNIEKGNKVLEVGTGSGYQAAVLSELGVKLFTIERQRELFLSSQIILKKLNYNPYCYYGDGYKGLPTYAPFDKILITAGAEKIPEELLKQLNTGGILVAPIGPRHTQDMIKVTKINEHKFKKESFGKFVFVPMLKGKN